MGDINNKIYNIYITAYSKQAYNLCMVKNLYDLCTLYLWKLREENSKEANTFYKVAFNR
jgi:hypothetical protein